jgi:branched-subunit amino acid aminotransferase/4-amino-4-deoxychorismate lyase
VSFIPTLIETIRVRNGTAPLWYLHLRRLSESCRTLGVPFPLRFDVPSGGADRVVKLEVGPKGMTVTERALELSTSVRLATVKTAHPAYPHKTASRDAFLKAREEAAAAGADDALLLTRQGMVAECGIWSLFWWEGRRVAGPPMGLGVLRGIARMRIEELQGPVVEQTLTRPQLDGRPLFVANAVRGVVPVVALDGVSVPESPHLMELAARFWP